VVNKRGDIVFVNEQLENNFGYSREQLIGEDIEKLLPGRFRNIHLQHRKRYFAEPRIRVMGPGQQLFGLHSDGTEFPVEVSLSPLETETDTLVIASIRDISERAQAELKIRALASSLLVAEQEERQRIAQILHDDLQQRLFAIKMQMPYLSEAHEKNDEQAFQTNFEQLQTWLADAISTTRGLSKDISPLILKREGLVEALKWLATQMKELYNLDVTLEFNDVEPDFDTSLETELFQAIRELLFNVVKHAETLEATVLLEKINEHLRVTVKDGGKGFDAEAMMTDWKDAHGLLNIHQRLSLLGCNLEVISRPGDGARIVIDVPA
jgi:PAS domain S-box-containing protein